MGEAEATVPTAGWLQGVLSDVLPEPPRSLYAHHHHAAHFLSVGTSLFGNCYLHGHHAYHPGARACFKTCPQDKPRKHLPQTEPAVEKGATCDIMRSVHKGNTTAWERLDKMLVLCHGCCTVGVLGEGPWRTAQRNPVCGERTVGINSK